MPAFHPPLSTTTVVHRGANGDEYAHLDFHLTFEDPEDTTGTWEIWTDVPSLNTTTGELAQGPGAWHAITFHHPKPREIETTSSAQSSASAYRLPEPVEQAAPEPTNTVMIASATIRLETGAAYAYTFRRVMPDGHTHWLGGEGSNGVIQVGGEDYKPEDQFENGNAKKESTSLQVNAQNELSLTNGSDALDTILTATISTVPFQHGPFATTSSSYTPGPNDTVSKYTVTIHPAKGTTSPESSLSSATGSSLTDFQSAFKEAFKQSSTSSSGIAAPGSISVSGSGFEDVLAVFHSSSTPPLSHTLAIIAGSSIAERSLSVGLPSSIQHSGLSISTSKEDVPAYLEKGDKLEVTIPKGGLIRQSLALKHFDVLAPGEGREDLRIVCPSQISMEQHEYTVEESQQANGLGHAENPTSTPDDAVSEDTPILEPSSLPVTQEEEVAGKDAAAEPSPGGWWLFQLLSRFFSSLFEWLKPVDKVPGPTTVTDTDGATTLTEDEDDDVDYSEAHTPVDERTPLMRSPQISRDTQSTAASMPSSPLNYGTKALDQFLPIDRLNSLVQSDRAEGATKTVRYWTYKLDQVPPFQFYLPPRSNVDNWSFSVRSDGEWAEAQAELGAQEEGRCVRLTVVPTQWEGKADKAVCEVKVESK